MRICVADEKSETENSASRDQEPLDSVAEIELAVERGVVTFPMVMKALYLPFSAETAQHLRQRYQDVYRPALLQFMIAQGGIDESFYANEFGAGALLTCMGELFSNIWWDQLPFDTTKARALEADINDLLMKAGHYLSECHSGICKQRLFRLYKGLISSLRVEYHRRPNTTETGRPPRDEHIRDLEGDLEELRRELDGVRETYQRLGLSRGQKQYVLGVAAGTVTIIVLAAVAIFTAKSRDGNTSGLA
jgi:hypothetical protein